MGACGCFQEKQTLSYPAEVQVISKEAETAVQYEIAEDTKAEILVHVCGAVKVPGVYKLNEGARVYQAVEAAGGFLDTAESKAVNLAGMLSDGQQLWIPVIGETVTDSLSVTDSLKETDSRISINRATKEELMKLPGIGESRAEAIIAYRTEHGAFSKPEDIMLVSGIKEAAYAKLKDRITAD